MENIWFVSDTHFGHKSIIKYCSRPYASTEEMDEDIVKRWNDVVGSKDIVWHLGDFGMGDKSEISRLRGRLRGRIKLIKGNHDRHTNSWYRDCGFAEVYDRPVLIQDFWLLSHAPLEFMRADMPFANIFGHVHNDNRYPHVGANFFNACLEVNNYSPILFDDIKSRISAFVDSGAES